MSITDVDPLFIVSVVAVAHHTELCGRCPMERVASSISVALQHNPRDQAWRGFMDHLGRVVGIVMG